MKIVIGADLVPTPNNYQSFINAEIDKLVDKSLLDYLNTANYRIFNLEVPLVDKEEPIIKCGPNLCAPTNTIKGIKALGVNLLTLANNHILDQGEQGLNSTIKVLNENDIKFVGAGNNLSEAKKTFVLECKNAKVGIYCCAEHEFSIATNKRGGANPFDPLESFDDVQTLKEKSDYVIVLYHGGKEHYRYPSPNLQKICRKFIEKGADLVVCQHSHCVGCQEKYQSGTIVYGQGNFLFDMLDNEYWNTSLLIEIDLSKNFEISYIPIKKNESKISLADQTVLDEFYKRSDEIKKEGVITKKYEEFATQIGSYYLMALRGHQSFLARALNKLTKGKYYAHVIRKHYKQKDLLFIANYLECEAHHELLAYIINKKLK